MTGNYNTGVGAAALLTNTADENTAIGAGALLSNTDGSFNTANGAFALFSNTTGRLQHGQRFSRRSLATPTGSNNTATGYRALQANTTGADNTATGVLALANNTEGDANTATGYRALHDNTTGIQNTAIGYYAGHDVTGDDNVCIGANVFGAAGVDNTTWIRNVYDSVATARAVYVNADNKIGTLSSSRRYKEEIRPMAEASEAILALRPMTFRYKKDIDPTRSRSFGLIAEDVAKVSSDLITCDELGNPQTVRYEAINAMLLNEFLKEHRKNEEQQGTIGQLKSNAAKQDATIAQQQKQIEALTAGLQKVSAQLAAASPSRGGLEASKFAAGRIRGGGPAPQVVNNP